MLTQHNCFDTVWHILLKQNMDITTSKIFALFRTLLDWSSSNKDLQSYAISTKVRNHLTFKHHCTISELVVMKF